MPNSFFGFFIDAVGAYTQVCCLLGSLLCLGIGTFLLGNGLYWRLHGERVSGTITGLRNRNGSYYPVYRYTLSNGQTIEATSDSGSSSPYGNETGKVLPLLVFPSHPDQARRANSYIFEIIGFFFAAPGVFFLYLGCTAWPVKPATFVVLGAMAAFAAIRLHGIILPKDKRMPLAAWKAAQQAKFGNDMQAIPVKAMETVVSATDQKAFAIRQAKSYKQIASLFIVLGPLLVVGSFYLGQQMLDLTNNGLRAAGRVVSMESSMSGHKTTYHAIVLFSAADGRSIRFKDNTGSNPPMYHAGENVTVLYLADRPERTAVINRGIWNWLAPGILFVAGAAMALTAPALFRKSAAQPPPS